MMQCTPTVCHIDIVLLSAGKYKNMTAAHATYRAVVTELDGRGGGSSLSRATALKEGEVLVRGLALRNVLSCQRALFDWEGVEEVEEEASQPADLQPEIRTRMLPTPSVLCHDRASMYHSYVCLCFRWQ